MRYTTIIDITELPSIYRNHNARLVYLHLVLKCGYHDTDRDLTDTSIRQLSAAVGLTIAATRHALLQLQAVGLLSREGRDATRIIKEVNHDMPVIALSAYAFEENIREAKAAGCDEFLAKPFRVEDLLDLVQKYINK